MAFGAIVEHDTSFSEWRPIARQCFLAGVPPEELEWRCASAEASLFDAPLTVPSPKPDAPNPILRSNCLALLKSILRHADQTRFDLAYRILWRAQSEPSLAAIPLDPDIARALRMVHQIRRDAHKMEAFLRFRDIGESQNGRRLFLAWFEPDHYILPTVAPFFTRRFTDMDWAILTPKGSITWNGEKCTLSRTACSKPDLSDSLEQLWQTYYMAIFNPARIKTKAMRSEMPRKYWKNLPETRLIPQMLAQAGTRVKAMETQQPQEAPYFHKRLQQRRTEKPEP
ncbi:DNA polymerase [Acetobacter senegalensis]|uniref:DNA polymerase n=1 Tax=Acetobacter senegalensis TaxID=446692 RepID=A0A149U3Q6_9PROT|nr:TIGR03915 family putative DNA repair protein [Acetobacter senegalensis]KXV59987.1 DNA polymerase [Acetobacter senegalensis]